MSQQPPPSDAPVLDAQLLDSISDALEPSPEDRLDAGTQERIKRKLLRRIAAASTERHLTLADPAQGWSPFGPGVSVKVLHTAEGVMSYLLRLAPGAHLPAHRHPVDEECVVLEGEVRIGELRLKAGAFHLGREGVLHDRLESPGGALIFLRGAVPEAALAL
jgi:anti-sigma factor ChrR (cupin superfamily)